MEIQPLDYTICINVSKDYLVISQPNLGLVDGRRRFDELKTLHEIGELVGEMMLKVKKEIARRTVLGAQIPPPSKPKETLCIPDKEQLSLPEASRYLGVSQSTMRRMCRKRDIPSFKNLSGKHFRIRKLDLDHYQMHGKFFREENLIDIPSESPSLADFMLSFL